MLEDLKERGFFQQSTHPEELAKRLKEDRICCYVGFDPTADSLHVGHLIPLMGLAHMQRGGHRIIALMGGGTSMIGDPSGKTELRKMLTEEQLQSNIEGILPQMERFLDFSGDALLVNNSKWLRDLNYIDFLRDIGRHFSVNRMLSFETYKIRLETGLSFLEFNYQLLQAFDFLELNRRYNCTLQMGGDDQWANIISGTDLIRRVERKDAFGWTYPLLTTSSGKKMGKTEKGALWLDPKRTSAYEYYQYWVNTEDTDVEKFLALFTFLPMSEVRQLGQLQGADIREAKQRLAFETTALIHGKETALQAQEAAQSLFSGDGKSDKSNVPSTTIAADNFSAGLDIFESFLQTGLCKSKGEARRLQAQGGVYVNDERIDNPEYCLGKTDLQDGEILLRAGKKRYHRLIIEN
ncbi:MAG: tyrosine--tRNA ligase [Proteobacteria bacterium]|jgi:tyrosyl-tRNA synthetase|nr:tyrosine--tRNA ligase [Pseudomonadota bacterium]MBT5794782.1 tyrosine--tRNA ligase [Deltaproteobacteria bacterium]